jgi:hypothetical protein
MPDDLTINLDGLRMNKYLLSAFNFVDLPTQQHFGADGIGHDL